METIPFVKATMLKCSASITVDHGLFSDIRPTNIHFGQPNLLYIFNGRAINNLQKSDLQKTAKQFLTIISITEKKTIMLLSSGLTKTDLHLMHASVIYVRIVLNHCRPVQTKPYALNTPFKDAK